MSVIDSTLLDKTQTKHLVAWIESMEERPRWIPAGSLIHVENGCLTYESICIKGTELITAERTITITKGMPASLLDAWTEQS